MNRSGVDNTETNRRDWRELLYTAPGLGQYISGCIMFEETLYQSTADGVPFVKILQDAGIVPGIKVDTGLQVNCPNPSSSLAVFSVSELFFFVLCTHASCICDIAALGNRCFLALTEKPQHRVWTTYLHECR